MFKDITKVVLGIILCLGLVGCANHGPSHKGHGKHHGANHNAEHEGAGDMASFSGKDAYGRSQKSMMAKRTFRFEFDRHNINDDDYEAITQHANYLAKHPKKSIRIEGHTDQQGSREYNVGLGEKRAKAISNILLSNGASSSQVHLVSYGEEKPEAFGDNEDAYRMNRRAVIFYEEH